MLMLLPSFDATCSSIGWLFSDTCLLEILLISVSTGIRRPNNDMSAEAASLYCTLSWLDRPSFSVRIGCVILFGITG